MLLYSYIKFTECFPVHEIEKLYRSNTIKAETWNSLF